MKRFLQKILIYGSFANAILLVLSYLSTHFSPDIFPYLSFLGIFYPLMLITACISFMYYAFQKKKYAFVHLAAILLGWNHIGDLISTGSEKEAGGEKFKVMSYNVRQFNRYLWIKDKEVGSGIKSFIEDQKPDILCIQEFYSREDKLNYQDSIIEAQNTNSYLISYKYEKKYSGNAIFSKFPIINEGMINIGISNRKCIYADIALAHDTIRVYSLHLASMHLSYEDYDLIEGLSSEKKEQKVSSALNLWVKLAKAYEIRAREIRFILPHLKTSPYPTIICGDFNDPPMSYAYRSIKKHFKDAFEECGSGIGRTYTRFSPTFRIDYILHNAELFPMQFERHEIELSDHYPITCTFGTKHE